MKRVLEIVVLVAVIGACGLLFWLNPGDVDFQFGTRRSIRAPLGLLLIFTFLAGVLATVIGLGLQQLGRRLAGWKDRRQTREAVRVGEWQHSGTSLTWGGELDRGRNLLRKAWRRQPKNGAAALALASSYMDTGEYATAREVLETAVAHDASDPDLRYALGEVLRRSGESAEAIRILETVRVQHPHAPRVLFGLRELYREERCWRDAVQVQEAYVKTMPNDGRATERGRLLEFRHQAAIVLQEPRAQVEALSAIVQDNRDFVPAVVSLGDALIACQRGAEATKLLERAFKHKPHVAFIERLLAQQETPRERQRTLGLMKKHEQELDIDRVHLLIARTALSDGDTEAAAAELAAVERQDTPDVQRCWAELYRRRGQAEEAWTALCRVVDDGASTTPR